MEPKQFEHLNLNFVDKGNKDGHINFLIGSDNYWFYVTGKVKLCDRETLVAVNSLSGCVLSGSIWFKSEKSVTKSLCWTHVLFYRDIVDYEKIISNEFCFKDADA